MNFNWVAWALKQKVGKSSQKLVLICLAQYADDNGENIFPTVGRLCEESHLDRKTVLCSIKSLLEQQVIEDTGSRKGTTNSVVVYKLNEQYQFRDCLNSPKNGTINKGSSTVFPCKQSQISHEAVPFFPVSSPKNGTQNKSINKSLNKSINKTDSFDQFWESCLEQYKRTGSSPGSRQKALAEFARAKDLPSVEALIGAVTIQANSKLTAKSSGRFAENFQHVERWIKNRRWEDVIIQEEKKPGNGGVNFKWI